MSETANHQIHALPSAPLTAFCVVAPAYPVALFIEKHLCDKCGTKLLTKGGGKAKTEVAEHTCKHCK